MKLHPSKVLPSFDQKKINRRQMIRIGLGATAAVALADVTNLTAFAPPPSALVESPLKAVAYNHIDYRVPVTE